MRPDADRQAADGPSQIPFPPTRPRAEPRVYTARVLGLSPLATAREILLPAALPEIITGIRVGFSLALIGTLLGEMFGAQHGLGHLLMQAMSLHTIDTIMALTLLVVLFAASVNAALLALDRRLHERA
jgi:NitT/TauT family transport system permease protein